MKNCLLLFNLLCIINVAYGYPKQEPKIAPEWQSQEFFVGHVEYINYDSSTHNIVATGLRTREIKGSEHREYGYLKHKYDTIYYHYVLDMRTGQLLDTLQSFLGKKTHATPVRAKMYGGIGIKVRKKFYSLRVEVYRYVVAKDYKGYDIAVEYWHKNWRAPYMSNYRIAVLKNNKVIQLYFIPIVADLLVVDNALYTYNQSTINKYSFDYIISKLIN